MLVLGHLQIKLPTLRRFCMPNINITCFWRVSIPPHLEPQNPSGIVTIFILGTQSNGSTLQKRFVPCVQKEQIHNANCTWKQKNQVLTADEAPPLNNPDTLISLNEWYARRNKQVKDSTNSNMVERPLVSTVEIKT